MSDSIKSEQIVRINGANFEFDIEKFKSIISNSDVSKDMEVSVILINGPLRTGKSFFSNFVVRYLENDSNDTVEDYFKWKKGSEIQTLGIWMLDKIFIYENKAIIIMDTQGIFDSDLQQSMTIALLSLSTIISSYQIYNIDKRIQEDHLQYLAYFSEYSRLLSSNKNISNLKIGQHLSILVRDWQNYLDNNNLERCKNDMIKYQNAFLLDFDKMDNDKQMTRSKILDCYSELDCYLLPHPGYKVSEEEFSGKISDIRPEFMLHVNNYIKNMLDTIKPRKLLDSNLTLGNLEVYIKKYVDMYHDIKDNLPKPMTLLETTETVCHDNALNTSIKSYKNLMCDRIKGKYLSLQKIEEIHKDVFKKVLDNFDSLLLLGSEDKSANTRSLISLDMNEEYKLYAELAIVNPYVRIFKDVIFNITKTIGFFKTLVFGIWSFNIFIDYTCSFDVCITFSSLLTRLFYLFFGIIVSQLIKF